MESVAPATVYDDLRAARRSVPSRIRSSVDGGSGTDAATAISAARGTLGGVGDSEGGCRRVAPHVACEGGMAAAVADELDSGELAGGVEGDVVVQQSVIAGQDRAVGQLELGAQAGLDDLDGLVGAAVSGHRDGDDTPGRVVDQGDAVVGQGGRRVEEQLEGVLTVPDGRAVFDADGGFCAGAAEV